MQVAIAIGTLLLGSWVLNSPVEEEEIEEQPALTTEEPGPSPMPTTERKGKTDWGMQGLMPGAEGQPRMRSRSTPGNQQPRMQQRQMLGMPLAPTDTAGPGARGQLSAPTSSELGPGMYGMRTPSAPTAQRRSQATYHPMSHGQQGQNSGVTQASAGTALMTQQSMAQQGAATAPPGSDKLFAGYRAPSGISPYMNIFRGGTALGTIDNYTSLVRPELEQRYMNQQFNRDIIGLERNNRMQQMRMQMLNQQQFRSLQGVGTPQFYMNYGGYYQGAGQ